MAMEAPLLNDHHGGRDSSGDYRPVTSLGDAWRVFLVESRKLWAIAAPICLNIICLYGLDSATQIFVGHIGALQLSAAAIGLSVISGFAFGFLVVTTFFIYLFMYTIITLFMHTFFP